MKQHLKLIILIATAPWDTAAYGQTTIGADIGLRNIESIATCAVTLEYPLVMKALSVGRDYKHDSETMPRLINNSCLARGVSVNIDPTIFRGALFRVLVRERLQGGVPNFGSKPYVEKGSWAQILNFAGCVVRADPKETREVVIAQPGSDDENKAFDELKLPISGCVPWKKMAWKKDALVYFFSEAYYHEADVGPSIR